MDQLRSERRRPVQIPQSDNSNLIEDNKLSLIGHLEYEKLEKHCFLCYSLCHEKENCPRNKGKPTTQALSQGISQQNTLIKLEEHHRKQDSRKAFSGNLRGRDLDHRDRGLSQRSVYSRLQVPERGRYPPSDKSRDLSSRDLSSRDLSSRDRERGKYEDRHEGRGGFQDRERSSQYSNPPQHHQTPSRRSSRDLSPPHRGREDRRQGPASQKPQSSRTPPPPKTSERGNDLTSFSGPKRGQQQI
ncbi:LOW QUALITY PROTEIN: hypothetical protein HID58_080274 [Brassica napus]|uniref:Zinc knuckle CX2CX4HX4C domain-containing protein n=1 Tax=Brassica napus TaxID=3708 RepID=A0ABQ7Y4G9_BRANA|nr:LOW QUALITY PROTEIN: hypothetical protein HID58_080274 [Brassica napus]